MRVVCDNCGATYKIPQTKLVKEVNKATCRKCGHRMLIRKPQDARGGANGQASADAFRSAAKAAASAAALSPMQQAPRSEWEEEDPTHIAKLDQHGNPLPPPSVPRPAAAPPQSAPRPAPQQARPQQPAPAPAAPRAPQPAPAPAPQAAAAAQPTPAPARPATAAPAAARAAFDPSGDLGLATFGVIVALLGALILAVNVDGGVMQRFIGLLMALWGTLTTLFVLVTGSRGRKKASLILSFFLGSFFAFGGAALIGLVTIDTTELGSMASLVDDLEPAAKTETPATPAAGVDERIDALFAEDDTPDATATTTDADDAATADDATADDAVAEDAVADAAPADATPEDEVLIPVKPTTTSTSASTSGSSRPSTTTSSTGTSSRSSTSSTGSSASSSRSSTSSTGSSASSSRSSTSSGSSSSGSSSASPSSSSSSASPSSSSSSGSSSSGMTTLPATVVDTMMKSNRNIKKCFYQEYKRSNGNLGTATIRFKVLPSGKVSSAYVTTSRYKGTELDSCLSSATYTVAFPAFDGDTLTLEWTGGAG